jgi:heme/copper-type cytochrome/quinol oxidase subunit 1
VASGVRFPAGSGTLRGILWLGILPLLAVPVVYALYGVESDPLRLAFTRLMQYGNGIAAIPLGLLVSFALLRSGRSDPETRPLRLALWMSLLLFASGGLISLFIAGVNTIIPAHYHGSTVGVTLALMGFAYLLLPHLGYPAVSGRLAVAQPLCYGLGQLLHITGLALSGALGVQRKTAGAAQGLEGLGAKLTMGIMALGGLLAVVGGILFVWIMLRAFLRRRHPA